MFQVKKDMEIDLTSEAPSVKPAEGWKFTEWDKDLKQTFTADTTITAEYKEIYEDDVVVPEKDDDPTPAGFWRVTFAKGEHGEFAGGKTVVFVKKNKEVDLKDNTPKVIAAEGYKFTDWDKKLKQTFAEDTTITAQYKKFENIEVPDNPTDPKPSEEYARITFG